MPSRQLERSHWLHCGYRDSARTRSFGWKVRWAVARFAGDLTMRVHVSQQLQVAGLAWHPVCDVLNDPVCDAVSYTHLTLPTNREV